MTKKVLEKKGGNQSTGERSDGNLVARRDHRSHQAAQKARDHAGDQAAQGELREDRMSSDNCRPHSSRSRDTAQ